jgi:DNA polymerase-1
MQAPTTRHIQFADYKANRQSMPEEIASALPYIKDLLKALRIPVLCKEGYEADDIIGTLSVKASKEEYVVYMVTPDKDFGQLVNGKVFMYKPLRTGTGFEILGEKEVCEKFGIKRTEQVIDLLGLWGDSSDNIPGVPGIGEVTARKLLEQFDNMDNLYAHTAEIENEKLRKKIEDNKQQAFDSRSLATIILDVPVEFNEEDLHLCPPNMEETKEILKELEMVNFGARLLDFYNGKFSAKTPAAKVQIPVATTPDLFSELDDNPQQPALEKPVQHGDELVITNLKEYLYKQKPISVEQEEKYFDLRIAAYVLNPEAPARNLNINDIDKLKQLLKEQNLEDYFYNVEMPLVWVLFRMEQEGIKLDVEQLKQFSKNLENQISDIEKKIYLLVGKEFNIGSPKQLGVVLFEELKIAEKVKHTKASKQYSTAEDVLEKYHSNHEIIPLVLQYRKLVKLKSTYADALPLLVDKNSRIHTTYQQTVTATGRLSSTNPNLQNIPIRTDLGREIRRAFVADNPEDLLLSADYSQIELRIVAAMSGDPTMLADFAAGHDIYTATAANIFGVAFDDVSSEMRRSAKAVNFGIVYGMSAHGLADRLGIGNRIAADIISRYFEKYSTLKNFLEQTIIDAKSQGYVTTLWGRRRYTPNVNSSNGTVRAAAERNAINAPIQGTSADMLKVAMVAIDKCFRDENLKSKMLLQVHDELVFNVKKDELEKVKEIVSTKMKEAGGRLNVPIEVDIKTADNWLDAK